MAKAKKKATARAVKPKSSGVRKPSIAKPVGPGKGNAAGKLPVASKKPTKKLTRKSTNKPTSKKAPGNLAAAGKASNQTEKVKKATSKKPAGEIQVNKRTAGRKVVSRKSASNKQVNKQPSGKKLASKMPASNKAVEKKPVQKKSNEKTLSAAAGRKMMTGKGIAANVTDKPAPVKEVGDKATVDRTSLVAKAAVPHKPLSRKADLKSCESNASNDSPESGKAEPVEARVSLRVSDKNAGSGKQPESAMSANAKTRKQALGPSHSSSPVQGKPAQKKRGWRDIEALTERARLKSLLSDIWHEDIDLDSDIFGERDSLFGYYTDKEEVVEVDSEDDEEWEEFEEEES